MNKRQDLFLWKKETNRLEPCWCHGFLNDLSSVGTPTWASAVAVCRMEPLPDHWEHLVTGRDPEEPLQCVHTHPHFTATYRILLSRGSLNMGFIWQVQMLLFVYKISMWWLQLESRSTEVEIPARVSGSVTRETKYSFEATQVLFALEGQGPHHCPQPLCQLPWALRCVRLPNPQLIQNLSDRRKSFGSDSCFQLPVICK